MLKDNLDNDLILQAENKRGRLAGESHSSTPPSVLGERRKSSSGENAIALSELLPEQTRFRFRLSRYSEITACSWCVEGGKRDVFQREEDPSPGLSPSTGRGGRVESSKARLPWKRQHSSTGSRAAAPRPAVSAFTLVELLVVIGIIAVLIGLLLPALSRAREQARSVACLSNLRQIGIACANYRAENNGFYPYGFLFERMSATTGEPTAGAPFGWKSWFTVLNAYMSRGLPGSNEPDLCTPPFQPGFYGSACRPLSGLFKCPSASGDFAQTVHYVQNPTIMPHMPEVIAQTAAYAPYATPLKPAATTLVPPDTAIFWDSNLLSAVDSASAVPFFTAYYSSAYSDPWPSLINGGTCFTNEGYPQFKYRGYFTSPDSAYADSATIYFPKDEVAREVDGVPSYNADYGGSQAAYPGNIRFRHGSKESQAGVAFADGSCRMVTLTKSQSAKNDPTSYLVDLTNGQLRMKWPTGNRPNPSVPPDF